MNLCGWCGDLRNRIVIKIGRIGPPAQKEYPVASRNTALLSQSESVTGPLADLTDKTREHCRIAHVGEVLVDHA